MRHNQFCFASEVTALLRSTSRRGLNRKIKTYMANYHPAGYGTRVVSRFRRGFLWCAKLQRSTSCD